MGGKAQPDPSLYINPGWSSIHFYTSTNRNCLFPFLRQSSLLLLLLFFFLFIPNTNNGLVLNLLCHDRHDFLHSLGKGSTVFHRNLGTPGRVLQRTG